MTRGIIPIPIESLEYANMKSRTLEAENQKLRETNIELLQMLEGLLHSIEYDEYVSAVETGRAHTLILKTKGIIK